MCGFKFSITTDFAGSIIVKIRARSLDPSELAGTIAAGFSNVFRASVTTAVITRPLTVEHAPARQIHNETEALGGVLRDHLVVFGRTLRILLAFYSQSYACHFIEAFGSNSGEGVF